MKGLRRTCAALALASSVFPSSGCGSDEAKGGTGGSDASGPALRPSEAKLVAGFDSPRMLAVDSMGALLAAPKSVSSGATTKLEVDLLTKIDRSGSRVWTRKIAFRRQVQVSGLVTDGADNVYVLFHADGTADLGGGALGDAASSAFVPYLTQLGPDGVVRWTKALADEVSIAGSLVRHGDRTWVATQAAFVAFDAGGAEVARLGSGLANITTNGFGDVAAVTGWVTDGAWFCSAVTERERARVSCENPSLSPPASWRFDVDGRECSARAIALQEGGNLVAHLGRCTKDAAPVSGVVRFTPEGTSPQVLPVYVSDPPFAVSGSRLYAIGGGDDVSLQAWDLTKTESASREAPAMLWSFPFVKLADLQNVTEGSAMAVGGGGAWIDMPRDPSSMLFRIQ